MSESSALIAELRRIASVSQGARRDDGHIDDWQTCGLPEARLHEIYAGDTEDGAAAAGFAIALAMAARAMPLLWLRTERAEARGGLLHAGGLAELGVDASALVLAVLPDAAGLLRAAADAARCAGLGTLLIEMWGRAPEIDLTATRRLMLAAEASGVTVLLLRIDADPVASAAASRWGVVAAPSVALETAGGLAAPGLPAFDIELLRRRGGPAGARWHVEWNRDACQFQPRADDAPAAFPRARAPLSGAAIPLGGDRAAARRPAASVRRTG